MGPLVICAIVFEDYQEPYLRRLGVKDSKLLTPGVRKRLARVVAKRSKEFLCTHITAKQLNDLMQTRTLNEIEAMKIAELLRVLKTKPKKIFIDSPDPNPKKFEQRVRRYIHTKTIIRAENFADRKYPVVGAASILAKVERDSVIERIKKEVGENFGSGYPSDPRTIAFLKRRMVDPGVKKYLRREWKTLEKIKQRKLTEF